jgi:hypothetical protein
MFGSFFDTAEVDKYADWIVNEVKRSLPPGCDPSTKKIAEQAQKLNERIAQRTGEFTKKTNLNIYKKAHLAARVREGMNGHGYPESFVKSFSYDLLGRIQLASNRHTH